MSKYLFYSICKLTMTTHYEDEDTKLDKILLIVRRVFLVLFIWFILWIVLFKIIWINKDSGIIVNWDTTAISWDNQIDLWKNYSKDDNYIYYKWEIISFVDVNKFYVINEDWNFTTQWIVVNSSNLLKIFADYNTRSYMMKQIDGIIKNEKNITSELKWASENWLYKMNTDEKILSQFDRDDRYDMTNEQRAKFAVMFLYIKIAKSMNNSEVSMKAALNELKYFLENFDENNLKDELDEDDMNKIRWDIWLDDHCIYKNWELYACFLDKIFVK